MRSVRLPRLRGPASDSGEMLGCVEGRHQLTRAFEEVVKKPALISVSFQPGPTFKERKRAAQLPKAPWRACNVGAPCQRSGGEASLSAALSAFSSRNEARSAEMLLAWQGRFSISRREGSGKWKT